MKLAVGDLVSRVNDPETLGIILELFRAKPGAPTCEPVIVYSKQKPATVGQVLYLHQEYWTKVEAPCYLQSGERNF